MKFIPTLWKTIVSIAIGFIIGILAGKNVFWGNPTNIILSFWVITSIIVYVLWSLIQKKS